MIQVTKQLQLHGISQGRWQNYDFVTKNKTAEHRHTTCTHRLSSFMTAVNDPRELQNRKIQENFSTVLADQYDRVTHLNWKFDWSLFSIVVTTIHLKCNSYICTVFPFFFWGFTTTIAGRYEKTGTNGIFICCLRYRKQ